MRNCSRAVSCFAPRNDVAEFFGGGLAGIFVGALAQNIRQRRVQADKFHQLSIALLWIVAPLQNHGARFHAGIFKPRLGVAFQNGVNLEILQNPFLQGKAVFDIQPA